MATVHARSYPPVFSLPCPISLPRLTPPIDMHPRRPLSHQRTYTKVKNLSGRSPDSLHLLVQTCCVCMAAPGHMLGERAKFCAVCIGHLPKRFCLIVLIKLLLPLTAKFYILTELFFEFPRLAIRCRLLLGCILSLVFHDKLNLEGTPSCEEPVFFLVLFMFWNVRLLWAF